MTRNTAYMTAQLTVAAAFVGMMWTAHLQDYPGAPWLPIATWILGILFGTLTGLGAARTRR